MAIQKRTSLPTSLDNGLPNVNHVPSGTGVLDERGPAKVAYGDQESVPVSDGEAYAATRNKAHSVTDNAPGMAIGGGR